MAVSIIIYFVLCYKKLPKTLSGREMRRFWKVAKMAIFGYFFSAFGKPMDSVISSVIKLLINVSTVSRRPTTSNCFENTIRYGLLIFQKQSKYLKQVVINKLIVLSTSFLPEEAGPTKVTLSLTTGQLSGFPWGISNLFWGELRAIGVFDTCG